MIAGVSPNAPLRSIYLTLSEGLESMLEDSVIDEFDGAASVAIHRVSPRFPATHAGPPRATTRWRGRLALRRGR